jgi:hypothetical protein
VKWVEDWLRLFAEEPTDRTSREVSVQDVLAVLIVGRKPAWFEPCVPTPAGRRFLGALWREAFGDAQDLNVTWFVSEYALPVPPEWRAEIGLTYGCPDFACHADGRIFILELKTERGSYRPRQLSDYLRLARRMHPDKLIDVALLGPTTPGDRPMHDDRQRYAEFTWSSIPALLESEFANEPLADTLARFLRLDLTRPEPALPTTVADGPIDELIAAAVAHAQRIAPSVVDASPGDATERGIDVPLPSLESARTAQRAIQAALAANGLADRVSVWLWRPSSTGVPATEAGRDTGQELRLAPIRRKTPRTDA